MNKITNDEFRALEMVHLWSEDDAAPDAERVDPALKRIWPYGRFDATSVVFTRDDGDVQWFVYNHCSYLIIVGASYRGNNSISVANKPKR